MGKPTTKQYRDEVGQCVPTSSSAVLLDDIDYNDDDLPAYTDLPSHPEEALIGSETPTPSAFLLPNRIPGGTLSRDESTTSTIFPVNIEHLIREEMKHPPRYYMRIHGTHSETRRKSDGKTERKNLTDFDVKLDMTYLLICKVPWHQDDPTSCYFATSENPQPCRYIHTLKDGDKGYRGGTFPSRLPPPSSSDPEHDPPVDDIQAWSQAYSSSHHTMRTFTFSKAVTHHDTETLTALARELVNRTNYRGHTQISFPTSHSRVTVYSDCRINHLRFNKYVCWGFYLTFLWIFSWPIIWFMEKKYKPITMWYPYTYLTYDPTKPMPRPLANRAPADHARDETLTRPLVQAETQFFGEWELSINRAVMTRHQGWIDTIYRADTEELAHHARVPAGSSAFVNNLLSGVSQAALGVQAVMGWGADS